MSFISKHASKLIVLIFLIFWLFWQGIPAFNRWRADKLVDELCAKDGGIKVYETVTLPKERFDVRGQFYVSVRQDMKPTDEYYTEWDNQYYKMDGTLDLEKPHRDKYLEITQSHNQVYRKLDNKLLGESISYWRSGGDAIGPWHMSSYDCPQNNNLEKQIFFIEN